MMTGPRRTIDTALLVGAMLLSACAPESGVSPMVPAGPDIGVGAAVLEIEAGSVADSLMLSTVGRVADEPSGFLITDVMNDRVVRVDTLYHEVAAFGRSGSGPGEMDGPIEIVRTGDRVIVGDMGNGRFSVFDASGRYLSVIASEYAGGSFGVRSDGGIVAAAPSESHYARLIRGTGDESPILERPRDLAHAAEGDFVGTLDASILVGAGDTTHVFDDQLGVLLKYDDRGRLRLVRSLPPDVLDAEREYRRQLAEDLGRQGRRLLGAPHLKTMRLTSDGQLFLLLTRDDLVGLLVDPHDYGYRRVTAPLREDGFFQLRTSIDVSIRGDVLHAFGRNGLSTHGLMDAQ